MRSFTWALKEAETGGRWTHVEMSNHINYLEILAIFHALKSFKIYLRTIEQFKIQTAQHL
jgi:hypothetical protein